MWVTAVGPVPRRSDPREHAREFHDERVYLHRPQRRTKRDHLLDLGGRPHGSCACKRTAEAVADECDRLAFSFGY
jgi:hypothetical protein